MEQDELTSQRYAFGEFVLDVRQQQLTYLSKPVPLTPKEFELLCVLVTHAGHLLHKEVLIQHVWPDTFVSDSSLLRAISVLRKQVGHDSIRTVPKRGYAFAWPVIRLSGRQATSVPAEDTAPLPLEEDEQQHQRNPDSADGQAVTLEAIGSNPPNHGSRSRLNRGLALGIAVLALALGVSAAVEFRWLHRPLASHHPVSTAKGLSPQQAAVAARLLVLNQHENSVSLLDTVTQSAASTVVLPADPRGIAILPDTPDVYVSLNGANSVAVIDTRNHRVVATIPVGRNPVGLVANPRPPFVYVANNYSNTVSVIDSTRRAVVRTLAVGSVPTEIAVAGDGTRAIVTNQSGGSISIIDSVANVVLSTIPVGSTPVGVAFTPDSKFAWITLAGQNEVAVIDVAAQRVVHRIPVGAAPVRVLISRDGRRALVSNFLSNTLTLIDTASMQATGAVSVGLNPVGVTFNPAGDLAYVANYGSNTVSILDASTMKVLETSQVGKNPVEVAVLPCYVIACDLPQHQESANLR